MKEETLVDIDQFNLDKEWVNQPRLFLKYSEELAQARFDHASLKASLEMISAKLDKEIRCEPDKFGLEKITEPSVANTILLQKGHRAALQLLNEAKFKVDMLQAAVEALDHRKKALENLVDLHGQGYFAEPQARTEKGKEAAGDLQRQGLRRRTMRD